MRTPEEIADEIVGMGEEAALRECDPEHDNAAMLVCSACLRSMIASAIREAEIRGASWGLDAARAAHNAAKGACESRDCCEGITTIALRSLDPAAISAERTAGLSDGGKDRKATGELSVAQKSAPAPDAPCDFCLGRREVQKMGLCPQCRGSST